MGQYKCQEKKLILEHPKVEWSARKYTWQEIGNQCEFDYLSTYQTIEEVRKKKSDWSEAMPDSEQLTRKSEASVILPHIWSLYKIMQRIQLANT